MSVVPAPALAQAAPTTNGGGADRCVPPGDGFSALLALLVDGAASKAPDPVPAEGQDVPLAGTQPAPSGRPPPDGWAMPLGAASGAAIMSAPPPGAPVVDRPDGVASQDAPPNALPPNTEPVSIQPVVTLPAAPSDDASVSAGTQPAPPIPSVPPAAPRAPASSLASRLAPERAGATRAAPDPAGTNQATGAGPGPHPTLVLPATEADGDEAAASLVPPAMLPGDDHSPSLGGAMADQPPAAVPQAGDAPEEQPRTAAYPARPVPVRSPLPRLAGDADAETEEDPPMPAPQDAASLPPFTAPFVTATLPPPAPPAGGPSRVGPAGDRAMELLAPQRLSPGVAPGTDRMEDAPPARAMPAALDADIAPDAAPSDVPPATGAAPPPPAPPLHPASSVETRPAPEVASAASRPTEAPARQVAPALVAIFNRPGGGERIVVRLEPRDLGQVELRVERPDAASAQVHVSAEKPQTLALLLADRPRLEQALDQAGVPAHGRDIVFHLAPPEPIRDSALPQQPAPWSDPRAGAMATSDGGSGQAGGGGQRPRPDAPAAWGRPAEPGEAADWLRAGLDITA